MTTYGYIRASTVEQQDTLTAQQNQIKKYCELKDLTLKDIYIDSGISGSTAFKDRPEGRKLFEKLTKGDTLIVCKLDRISRNVADFVNTLNYFSKNKIIFVCIEPNIDLSNPFGMFMAQILSSIAELERGMTIERVKKTIQTRKDNKMCVGSIPYGFKKTEDKKLIEDKEEQNIINKIRIYKEIDKLNNKQIVDKLNEENIKNRNDKKWYPETIRRICGKNAKKAKI
ncbi:hypothetical protein EKK58_04255 [Candidatus Dependentiae bacterium]|nr:MAG: hypothetical protein EKK58_04255 [Candidatus Dependentiae bacterium]